MQNGLSLADMAMISRLAGTLSLPELARRLGKDYFTVHKAVRRVQRGVSCPIAWHPCSECGQPIGEGSRLTHVKCLKAKAARRARERRQGPHTPSTKYVARYRLENPERNRELREREKAAMRERWPDLPQQVRDTMLERAHASDSRDYPITLGAATASGLRWSEDDDRVVWERLKDPARDVALELGRTLWGVRQRRVYLRRQEALGLTPDGSRCA